MDMRDMRGMDGRRLPPRNARGEFRRRRSGRRGDRGMPMHEDMRRDMNYTGGRGGYPMRDYGDMRGDYNYDMARQGDMRNDYARQGGYDGHYPQGQGSTYYPIEAMGVFNGYYGMPEQDYARGGRRDYGYDMRYGRDYGYPMYEHDYGYGEDYGEKLSDKELEEFCHKLKSQLTEQEKQMFSKEALMQRAKSMGRQMEGFSEKEVEVVALMLLDDYKKSLGTNPDLMVKLAFDWLDDKDAKVKGAEKLAVYYDEIVMGGEDD
jgi:hypothetical protein